MIKSAFLVFQAMAIFEITALLASHWRQQLKKSWVIFGIKILWTGILSSLSLVTVTVYDYKCSGRFILFFYITCQFFVKEILT